MSSRPLAWPVKLLLGCTFAVLVFALLLGALELGLHVFGYGHSTRFHRTERSADGTTWIRENRWVAAPFFAPEIIRRPQQFRLPAQKAPRTYRVFVLGGSAAMGDPEASFSVARALDVLLRNAHPEINFEIVNAGITAINSTVVRGIAADCAELEPDLFVVYVGNNEVVGPFGPGTVLTPFLASPGAVRIAVALKRTRTGQLLTALGRNTRGETTRTSDWGGMGMFLQHGIAEADPRLATTRALFRENLAAIAASGHSAGATVLLCTVPANLRDFAPFLSLHRPDLSAADLARWQELFTKGAAAAEARDLYTALPLLEEAARLDERHAETRYLLGFVQMETGAIAPGRESLQRALDLDALRFRADSHLNTIIRSFAESAPAGLHVVDLASEIAKGFPGDLPGDESLYEHVHLNIRGTYRAARELCAPIEADLRRRGLVAASAPEPNWASLQDLRDQLAYTLYEQAMIVREMSARFSRAPFTDQRGNASRLDHYRTMENTVSLLLPRPEVPADLARAYDTALAARPDDWILRRNAGMALVALGQPERGAPLLEQTLALIPDELDALFALARAYQALGDTARAGPLLALVRALEPRYPGLPEEK